MDKTVNNIPKSFTTSDNSVIDDFFEPCLRWAIKYDRGVGFFSKGWLETNSYGISSFAYRGGKARFIVSPILSAEDVQAFVSSQSESGRFEIFEKALLDSVEKLEKEMSIDSANALAWLIFDEIIEFKFAVPVNLLKDGIFHAKFGIFQNETGERISFSGSINDSIMGSHNYENILVFKSWEYGDDYIDADIKRFEKLWKDNDFNLKIYSIPDAIRNRIFQLRKFEDPFKKTIKELDKWIHQDEAVETFLHRKHGILEMATGTGKTRTAIKIIQQLLQEDKIQKIVITMEGDELLDQWYKDLGDNFSNLNIRRQYAGIKELTSFLNSNKRNILLVSRNQEYLNQTIAGLTRNNKTSYETTMFIFDEVHGMGSNSLVENLSGKFHNFAYRLGLSATPEREYDEDGNRFIEQEIGETIFEFTLKDAIEKGVLCEFDYIPVKFKLSDKDKQEIRCINAKYAMKEKNKEPFDIEEKRREIASVYKLSHQKLPLFKELLEKNKQQNGNLLQHCLIFVETKEYGKEVQDILFDYCQEYHTYFAEDEKKNLYDFAKGKLKCLISCKKLSEGVDIKSVKNIVLFSSDKSKLVTIQRIGRSLRTNPEDPGKRANVIDFICDESNADRSRAEWLSDVAATREKKYD